MPTIPYDPAQRVRITQGDLMPFVQAMIEDAAGNPLDLVVASVRFRMVDFETDQLIIDAPAGILQVGVANKGVVEYQWQLGDTDGLTIPDPPGRRLFKAWFVVMQGSLTQRFPPDDRSFIVEVFARL